MSGTDRWTEESLTKRREDKVAMHDERLVNTRTMDDFRTTAAALGVSVDTFMRMRKAAFWRKYRIQI